MPPESSLNQRFCALAGKYLDGSSTRQEMDEFLFLSQREDLAPVVRQVLREYWETAKDLPAEEAAGWDVRFQMLMEEGRKLGSDLPLGRTRRGLRLRRAAYALLFLGGSWSAYQLLGYQGHHYNPPQRAIHYPRVDMDHEVAPGGNRALLTLGNGTTILLDSAHNGTIAQMGGTRVLKVAGGQLAIQASGQSTGPLTYNTVSTPIGGQYQVTLADGTKVWLNASSSLRFPNRFEGGERDVELSGEAYFEVSKDPNRPFKVQVQGPAAYEVQVYGTQFDVMAYAEEPLAKTTLLEGSVRISKGNVRQMLVPGDQAVMALDAGNIKVFPDADLDAAVAWKNGYFNFNRAGIQDIMRQLARWYDIQIDYRGKVPDKVFWGGIQRDLPLSDVLRILAAGGVQFSLEGNKVTVGVAP